MRKIDLNIMGHNKSTMPRGTVDYSKGLIYTIKTGESLYVGSTTDFRRRKYDHKSRIKTGNEPQKLYQTIRENNGGEWDMKPYQLFPCNSKLELEIEEERIRNMLNADLNCNKCSGIDEEKKRKNEYNAKKKWRLNNPEYNEKYRKENRDVLLKKKKDWWEKNREEQNEKKRIKRRLDKNKNKE